VDSEGKGNAPVAAAPARAAAGGRAADKRRAEASDSDSEEEDDIEDDIEDDNEDDNEDNMEDDDDDAGCSIEALRKTMQKKEQACYKAIDGFYKVQLEYQKQCPKHKLRKIKSRSPYPKRERTKTTKAQRMASLAISEARCRKICGDEFGPGYFKAGAMYGRGGWATNGMAPTVGSG